MNEATVIIAAWSAERFISKSIQSALAQEDVSVQVIVVDDASPDNTASAVASFPDVTYERLPENGGPSVARNAAIDLAGTEWVAVLDADDTLAPDSLKTLIGVAQDTQADIVLGNIVRVDETGPGQAWLSGKAVPEGQMLSLAEYLGHDQFTSSSAKIGYLKPLFRKSALDRLSLRYDVTLRNSEDFHIILRAIALGARVVVSGAPTYRYTVRAGSTSDRVAPEIFEALHKADRAFVQEFSSQLDDTARSLLQRRQVALRQFIEVERIMGYLKGRDPGQALRHFVRHPSVTGRLARQLSEALYKRIFSHKFRSL